MKKFCSYLRADLRKRLCSVKMILSVALTVVVLLLHIPGERVGCGDLWVVVEYFW